MAGDTKFETGAVRSADAGGFSFTSLPLVGLLGVARTSHEGATKYDRFNYMLGMPVHDILEHVFLHQIMFLLGDRTEPHLEHAAWGMLAAVQSMTLDPELNAPYLLSPGATLGDEMLELLHENAPVLAKRRASGELANSGNWSLSKLPQIARILAQRRSVQTVKAGEKALAEAYAAAEPDMTMPPAKEHHHGDDELFHKPCNHMNYDVAGRRCRECGLSKEDIISSMI
jgi:hypothetical protein